MSATTVVRSRFDSVDVLRGLAALAVVVYHLWHRYFPAFSTQDHSLQPPADNRSAFLLTLPIQYGYFGVTLFFVLSGFCIHLPQARRFHATGADGLRLHAFAGQRIRRLYPAYLGSIAFTCLAMSVLPLALAASTGTLPDIIKAFGLRDALANVFFLSPLSESASAFNCVYWTLIYEIQFYLAYPVLLWAVRRFDPSKVLLVLLAVEITFCAGLVRPSSYFAMGRWFEWYLGMCVAEGLASNRRNVPARLLTALGLTAGVAATLHPAAWHYRDLLLSIGFAGLLILCVRFEVDAVVGHVAWFCRSRTLITLGGFSYSLYLIHVPVIDIVWNAGLVAAKHHVISPLAAKWLAPISIPAALVLGYAFYHVFERSFLRRKSSPAPSVDQFETSHIRQAA